VSELPAPDAGHIADFVTVRLGPGVRDVRPLGAGKWSRAFAFDTDDRPLVIRFGHYDEDFAKDRIAATWHQPGVPVPEFIEMGEAFGAFYAITKRADGTFLDQLTKNDAAAVLPSVFHVLDSLRRVPAPPASGFGLWNRNAIGEHSSWKDMLLTVETTRPSVDGWRRHLALWPDSEQTFDEGWARLQALAGRVPSRHDVIHRDWMNRNVLVTDAKVTAVFDWGSSMYGDHLYDVAWLTFCASYTVGFDRLDMLRTARRHFVGAGIDSADFDRRITCYELHIGLAALIYRASLGDEAGTQWLAAKIRESLAL